jgi:hypothetical protein
MMLYAQSLKPRSIFIPSAKYGLLSTESFIGRLRDECLNEHVFTTLARGDQRSRSLRPRAHRAG